MSRQRPPTTEEKDATGDSKWGLSYFTEKTTYSLHVSGQVAQSCLDSLRPQGLLPTRLLCPRNSPGKNTGGGCHFLLQGVFPTQGQNVCYLHWPVESLLSEPQGSPCVFVPIMNFLKQEKTRWDGVIWTVSFLKGQRRLTVFVISFSPLFLTYFFFLSSLLSPPLLCNSFFKTCFFNSP